MKKNWRIYCLMCAIAYIEEISKPTKHPIIKNGIEFMCFHPTTLKMKNFEVVNRFFNITKIWQKKRKLNLLGKTFKSPRIVPSSGQFSFHFSPKWISAVIGKCGKIPNKYSFETAFRRINALKLYKKDKIDLSKNLCNAFLKDKKLAAGAFIISFDLECRGTQNGRPSLCMSDKFKDFLNFMLKVAQRWGWTNNSKLSPVNIENSLKLGIAASPQHEFRISIVGLKEIYKLSGPLADKHKDKCIKLHIKRSNHFSNEGYRLRDKNTKFKILDYIKKNKDVTTTQLQFLVKIGTDVILDHLHHLEKSEKVIKKRNGKRYIWNIKCQ